MANQSLNSLALIAARFTNMALEVLSQLIAVALVTLCQALDLRALQIGFLNSYRSEFSQLVRSSHLALDLQESGLNWLEKHGWCALLKSFDATASMDAKERFQRVAKSVREVVLDYHGWPKSKCAPNSSNTSCSHEDTVEIPTFDSVTWRHETASIISAYPSNSEKLVPGPTPELQDRNQFLHHPMDYEDKSKVSNVVMDLNHLNAFVNTLAESLHCRWCLHGDAYLNTQGAGDASSFLGIASRRMYSFIRRDLGVPLLHTRKLQTPQAELPVEGPDHDEEVPTVGYFTSIVYRAVRDGKLAKLAVELLRENRHVDANGHTYLNGHSVPPIADIRRDKRLLDLKNQIIAGLASNPISMPSLLLWNDEGQRLFDLVSQTSSYYLPKKEMEIMTCHADQISSSIPASSMLIELGCG